jgi:hypothetical protein
MGTVVCDKKTAEVTVHFRRRAVFFEELVEGCGCQVSKKWQEIVMVWSGFVGFHHW